MNERGTQAQSELASSNESASGAGSLPGSSAARVEAEQLVGRYRLLFPIAAGGMAEVWAAKPDGGGFARPVAIKLVRPEFAMDAEYARMFIDEAMVASAIRHPNICETYELGRADNLLFMVLEWVAGDSLSGLLRGTELNPLPDEIAARVCAEACAGLHAAHEATDADGHPLGVVHRDVSPPNILVSVHGHVKVSDFGIAKAKNQLHARTRTGEIKGKLAYIPPEQVLGQGVDRRADIYAMGCVLYVCTLGLRPFGSGAKALGNIVRGNYRKPRDLRPGYPEELQRIIARALAVDRLQRYQTADELRFDLEQWLLTLSSPTQSADVARVVRERLSIERKKMIDVLFSAGRSIPEAMAKRFLSQHDKTATPTATSGIVLQPPGLQRSQQQITVRPPAKEQRARALQALAHTAHSQPSSTDRADRASEDEPTLTAPPVPARHAPSGTRPAASPAGGKPSAIFAPPPAAEVTDLALRRMKPNFLPLALVVAAALLALLCFALTHP